MQYVRYWVRSVCQTLKASLSTNDPNQTPTSVLLDPRSAKTDPSHPGKAREIVT